MMFQFWPLVTLIIIELQSTRSSISDVKSIFWLWLFGTLNESCNNVLFCDFLFTTLTCMCMCGGGVSGIMSSSSVTVGLFGLLTSRLPNRTIPGIWVIFTWWGLTEPLFFRERLLLEEEGTAEAERRGAIRDGQISRETWSEINMNREVITTSGGWVRVQVPVLTSGCWKRGCVLPVHPVLPHLKPPLLLRLHVH